MPIPLRPVDPVPVPGPFSGQSERTCPQRLSGFDVAKHLVQRALSAWPVFLRRL